MKTTLAALLSIALLVADARAQPTPTVEPQKPIDYEAAANASRTSADPDAIRNYDRVTKAQLDYAVWSMEFRRAAFNWQYYSTILIFVAVIALISCGLFFSWTQFRSAQSAPTQTSVKLGKDGLEISSPVIGLLVLFLSLGFFYLYLTNVYPISDVISNPQSNDTVRNPR